MHRVLVLATVVSAFLFAGAAAAPASAQQVTHTKDSFSVTFDAPAGTLCDFAYHETDTVVENIVIFGDPDNPTRVIDHQTAYVGHENVDTGFLLSEVDRTSEVFNASDATDKIVGLFWHLRTPSGKLVAHQGGLVEFDTNTGDIIKITPHGFAPDFAAFICPLLGGAPAPGA
jgi:hypothetical protein